MVTSSVKELMDKYQFTYQGKCQCGGVYAEKYFKGKLTLKYRKFRFEFEVLDGNRVVKRLTPVVQLQAYLKETYDVVEEKKEV